MKRSVSEPPIVPDRIRNAREQSFAFIPHRFLRDGFFASLGSIERSLYLFLVLAADRNGVSFYGYDRICSALEVIPEDYIPARNSLIARDLIAFDGVRFQVLSLPERPVTRTRQALRDANDMERSDPATIRRGLLDALARLDDDPTADQGGTP